MPKLPDELAGAFTLAAASRAGWSGSAVDRRVRSGALVRLRAGVFLPAGAGPLTRAAAVVLATGGIASHVTAARVHGMWSIDEGDWATVPAHVHRRSSAALRIHRGDLAPTDVMTVRGVKVTTPLRTITDLCREASRLQAVCAIESALRLGLIGRQDLASLRGHAESRVRARARRADARSESPLETAVRLILVDSGIPVTPQWQVRDAAGIERYRIDLVVDGTRVAVECDGRGVHDTPAAVYKDRWRANDLATSWTVLRFTWWDVRHRPGYIVAVVRRAALSASA